MEKYEAQLPLREADLARALASARSLDEVEDAVYGVVDDAFSYPAFNQPGAVAVEWASSGARRKAILLMNSKAREHFTPAIDAGIALVDIRDRFHATQPEDPSTWLQAQAEPLRLRPGAQFVVPTLDAWIDDPSQV